MIKLIKLYKLVILGIIIISTSFTVRANSRSILYGKIDNYEDYVDVGIVATTNDTKFGIVGQVRIVLIPGSGNIIFDERTSVHETTIHSVINAVKFAESYTNVSHFDYFISYDLGSESVSGKSTGSSIGVGLLGLMLDKKIQDEVILTGGIDKDGNLEEVGSLLPKIITVGRVGLKQMIIPKNQATQYIYEKTNSKILAKKIDLKSFASENFNLTILRSANLKDTLSFVLI